MVEHLPMWGLGPTSSTGEKNLSAISGVHTHTFCCTEKAPRLSLICARLKGEGWSQDVSRQVASKPVPLVSGAEVCEKPLFQRKRVTQ